MLGEWEGRPTANEEPQDTEEVRERERTCMSSVKGFKIARGRREGRRDRRKEDVARVEGCGHAGFIPQYHSSSSLVIHRP